MAILNLGWSHQIFLLIGLLFVLNESAAEKDKAKCLDGWTSLHRGCYKFVTEEISWTDALDRCREESSDLVTILSEMERDDIERHLVTSHPDISSWWVGLSSEEKSGTNRTWKWLEGAAQVQTALTPWVNSKVATRTGEVSGVVEIKSKKLHISSAVRSSKKAFICEFHSISQRPDVPTTPIQPSELLTTEPSYVADDSATNAPEPTPQAVSSEVRPCAPDTDSGVADYGRVIRRLHSADDPLYRDYLQSEINANEAKVAYYQRVATAYEAALQQQNDYYERSKEKLRVEIDRLGKASTCI